MKHQFSDSSEAQYADAGLSATSEQLHKSRCAIMIIFSEWNVCFLLEDNSRCDSAAVFANTYFEEKMPIYQLFKCFTVSEQKGHK